MTLRSGCRWGHDVCDGEVTCILYTEDHIPVVQPGSNLCVCGTAINRHAAFAPDADIATRLRVAALGVWVQETRDLLTAAAAEIDQVRRELNILQRLRIVDIDTFHAQDAAYKQLQQHVTAWRGSCCPCDEPECPIAERNQQ